MDEGDQLLAAVLAHPEQDAPRAAYADWLQERDEPRGRERGAFIERSLDYGWQLAEFGLPNGVVSHHEYPYEAGAWPYEGWPDSLWSALTAGRDEVPTGFWARPHWHRGFIDRVEVRASEFVRPGFCETLFARQPVRSVQLYDRSPQYTRFATAAGPVLAYGWHRAGVLGSSCDLPPALFALVRRSPHRLNTGRTPEWAAFESGPVACRELDAAAVLFGRIRAGLVERPTAQPKRKPRRAKK